MTNAATTTRSSFEAYKHSPAGRFNRVDTDNVVRIASHPSFRDPREARNQRASRVQVQTSTGDIRHSGAVRRPPSSHSPRVRNRRRILIAALVTIAVLAVFLPARQAFGGKTLVSSERPSAEVQNPVTSIVVESGDTLWSIAQRLEPNRDPRGVVDELVDARGHANVYVGEKISWTK